MVQVGSALPSNAWENSPVPPPPKAAQPAPHMARPHVGCGTGQELPPPYAWVVERQYAEGPLMPVKSVFTIPFYGARSKEEIHPVETFVQFLP